MTPQQKTRDHLTAQGFLVGTVESRKSFPDKKKSVCHACGHAPLISVSVDLWNVFDVLAIHPFTAEIILIQTTSRANHSTRRNKILSSMEAKLVLKSGIKILLQSWAQDADTRRWTPKDEWITLKDFKSALHYPNDVAGLIEIKRKAKRPDLPKGSTLPLVGDESDLPPKGKTRVMATDLDNLPF